MHGMALEGASDFGTHERDGSMTATAPLDLKQCEKDLHAMTGSAASDAVTRATIGLKLLAALRDARSALASHMCDEEDDGQGCIVCALLATVTDK